QMLEQSVFVKRDSGGAPVIGVDGKPVAVNAAELADAKLNARRAMNYALCLGMQEIGQRRGWTLILLTTTLPPRWHPNPSRGAPSYDPSLSPIGARDEIQTRHHRAMALARERGCRYFAPRAREGQQDGTPHDHLAVFVHPDDAEA